MNIAFFTKTSCILAILISTLTTTACKDSTSDKGRLKLGVEYLDAFVPGEASYSLVFYQDDDISAGLDIMLWDQRDYDSTCRRDFASEYTQKDGVNYLWIHLNNTMEGTYRIVPDDGLIDNIYDLDEKVAIVSYHQEYDESKQPVGPYGNFENRHRAYSGEVSLKSSIAYDLGELNQLIDTTLEVSVQAAFANDDIRSIECSGDFASDAGSGADGGEEISCVCLNPDGHFHECQAMEEERNCCWDETIKTIEYTYETTARQCGYFCAISMEIVKNYCLDLIDEEGRISDNANECSGCEIQDSPRIFINLRYQNGNPADLESTNLKLTYRLNENDTEDKECWGSGPTLPSGYDFVLAFADHWGDGILLKAALPNGVSKEVDVPIYYTGCAFRDITYLTIVLSDTGEEIDFLEPEIINPCDMM